MKKSSILDLKLRSDVLPKLLLLLEYLFFLIAFNPDWKMNGVVWYAVQLMLIVIAFLNTPSFKFDNYVKWRIWYIIVFLLSLLWSIRKDEALKMFINNVAISAVLLSIYINIKNMKGIIDILQAMLFSLFVNGIYAVNHAGLLEYIGVPNLINWPSNSTSLRYALGIIFLFVLLTQATEFYKKIYYIICAVIFSYVLIFSGSRGGLILLLATFFFGLILKKNNALKKIVTIILIICLIIALFNLIMTNEILYNAIGKRFDKFSEAFEKGGLEGAEGARTDFIKLGFKLFLDRPLNGYGGYGFTAQNPLGCYSHNDYIELLVEFGLLGVFVYYYAYVYIIRKMKTSQQNSLYRIEFFYAIVFGLLIFNMVAITRYEVCVQSVLMLLFAHFEKKGATSFE